jgi:predicted molibdopterin-dependent oxidoreductase YjgC
MKPRLRRLAETGRRIVPIEIDGHSVSALEGDTVLVAVLAHAGHLRQSEFGDGPRAGFCLMGACQDCWVWTATGARVRACSTPVTPHLRVVTSSPEGIWPNLA